PRRTTMLGKVVVITGATSGTGRIAADHLTAQGAPVVLFDPRSKHVAVGLKRRKQPYAIGTKDGLAPISGTSGWLPSAGIIELTSQCGLLTCLEIIAYEHFGVRHCDRGRSPCRASR